MNNRNISNQKYKDTFPMKEATAEYALCGSIKLSIFDKVTKSIYWSFELDVTESVHKASFMRGMSTISIDII